MIGKIVGLLAFITICNAQKTLINVYYESLCPDSQAFITKQLYPTMTGEHNLANYLDVILIPYGKSTYQTLGSDVTFKCHHGENECYGNKLQSCAIKHIQVDSFQSVHTRESLILEYINCLMSAGNNFQDKIYPGEQCATNTKVKNWNNILACSNSSDGSTFLKKNGEKTDAFQSPLRSVPTVTYKTLFDEDFQKEALTNFRGAVCKKLSPKPAECEAHSSAQQSIAAILLTIVTFGLTRLF